MEITVFRPRQFRDCLRDYHLIAEGKKIAVIKPNSVTKVTLPQETKYIQGKIDWCVSSRFPVEHIVANRIVIKNGIKGVGLGALFRSLFRPSQVIVIESGYSTTGKDSNIDSLIEHLDS